MTPGWHPDPTGRFEYRYHNGSSWTADVAAGGHRYVDSSTGTSSLTPPSITSPSITPGSTPPVSSTAGNGLATAALTCGIVSLALGWIPVVFAVGAVLALLGVVFGVVGLRRSAHVGRGRGMAIGGIATGIVGVLVAVGGLVFTIAIYRAIERYENPVAHEVVIEQCTVVDGQAVAVGWLRNDSDSTADFSVLVEFTRESSGLRIASSRVRLDDVAPATRSPIETARRVAISDDDGDIACDASASGPLPFGVVPR